MRSSGSQGPASFPPKEEITREYHRLIAGLNQKNGGLLWWAGPLASKNPFDSPLYESLFRYAYLLDRLRRPGTGPSHPRVAAEDPLIARDLSIACSRLGAECELPAGELRPLWLVLLGVMHSFYFLFINLYRKILIRVYLGASLDGLVRNRDPAYVIRSWLDHRSFDAGGRYRDAYFGRLPDFIAASRRLVLVAGIVWTQSYLATLKKIRAQHQGIAIIPQEYFLTVSDIFRAAFLPLTRVRLDLGEVIFHGHDVKGIIAGAVREDRASLQIRNNLAIYYLTRRLAKIVPIASYIYSFENHAFEKMMILGIRESSSETRITGYQHGGLSRMLLNYFLGEGEAGFLPLPDRIITTGEETRRVLVEEGHFPGSMVRQGCALRYEYLRDLPVRGRGRAGSLFVPLPVDIGAARAVIDILVRAVGHRADCRVRLKHHPLIPREDILGTGGGKSLPQNIAWDDGKTTADLLMGGDITLYTQTTTCIEALMLGIPVVYLDIFTMFDADYVLRDIPFRWTADGPESLSLALSQIRGLEDSSFLARQKEGIAYARSFFAPVDEASLREFLM